MVDINNESLYLDMINEAEKLDLSQNRKIVDVVLKQCGLTKKELDVISYRFALKQGIKQPYSLQQIADICHMNYSEVSKCIESIFIKIAQSIPLEMLKESNDPGLIDLYTKISSNPKLNGLSIDTNFVKTIGTISDNKI